MDLVADFMELFDGLPEAHGTGAGRWIKRGATREDFEAHLNGDGAGLGIAPLRRDGTVKFAAIDLDEPDFEAARLMQFNLPGTTWLERSRSGNAHVWVFFDDPAPAWAVRGLLLAAVRAAGKDSVEVFPKQDRLLPDMVGNYINLPLHGDERPVINGIDPNQAPYTPAEFVGKAREARQSGADWEQRAVFRGLRPPEDREDTGTFGEAPVLHRCAQYMIDRARAKPIGEGSRHEAAFFLAKAYANYRDVDEDTAWIMLETLNEDIFSPPLSEHELARIHRNAHQGGFVSTGCDNPLLSEYVDPACPIASGLVGR